MYRNLDTHPRKTHVTRAATTVTAATFCVTMLGAQQSLGRPRRRPQPAKHRSVGPASWSRPIGTPRSTEPSRCAPALH